MAYLTERIMDTVKTIATLNDSDNISLLDTLNGLNDLRGRNEWSLVQITTLDCERDDNGTLLVWRNGHHTYDVIAPTFDDSLFSLEEACEMLYAEWQLTDAARFEEFSLQTVNTWASYTASLLLRRLASVRYAAYQRVQSLAHDTTMIDRYDNTLTLNNR